MLSMLTSNMQIIGYIIFTIALIVLALVDLKTQLLPDRITLPLLWLGLFFSVFSIFAIPKDAILGAILGYLVLWIVTLVFKWLTGREGMGQGDFKLLAALGAWLGWQQLPFIILFSSLLGSIVGVCSILLKKKTYHCPIPFGPFLAISGWISLLWGSGITKWYWEWIM